MRFTHNEKGFVVSYIYTGILYIKHYARIRINIKLLFILHDGANGEFMHQQQQRAKPKQNAGWPREVLQCSNQKVRPQMRYER